MKHIKSSFSDDLAKKIIGNTENASKYLMELKKQTCNHSIKTYMISRGKNAGSEALDLTSKEIWKTIVDTWEYEIGKTIIRSLFVETEKYKNGKEAVNAIDILIKEWEKLKLGDIAWPFSQGAFDEFVQRVNSEKSNGYEKDTKVKIAAVKYRRIKEINTVRNDFIETLIFEKNENILPTLNHRRGVDFFINGISFDQKVAKSPTNEFKRYYGENWKQVAVVQPELVAKYLYTYQDEGRFGADPRLLVVYLDEDVSIEKIKNTIDSANLYEPIEVTFTYKHKTTGEKNYKVACFVILLHN